MSRYLTNNLIKSCPFNSPIASLTGPGERLMGLQLVPESSLPNIQKPSPGTLYSVGKLSILYITYLQCTLYIHFILHMNIFIRDLNQCFRHILGKQL